MFGQDFGLIHEAIITGKKLGIGRNFWSALAHDPELFSLLADFVVKVKDQREAGLPENTYLITVDPSMAIEHAIEVSDCTAQSIGCFTSNQYPVKDPYSSYALAVELFELDRDMTVSELDDVLEGEGLSSVNLRELLAFRAQHQIRCGKIFSRNLDAYEPGHETRKAFINDHCGYYDLWSESGCDIPKGWVLVVVRK